MIFVNNWTADTIYLWQEVAVYFQTTVAFGAYFLYHDLPLSRGHQNTAQ